MKIEFKKVRWKNLLSTGNSFIEIDLLKSTNTLIIGENGSGKSTFLEALCYGLFKKPFRKANIPEIINSINKKELLVEIEFSIGKNEYFIRRGMKPNIFEVYENDCLINQSSTTIDYQKHLEQNILRMSYKAFTQIVILGSSSYTPFMRLSSSYRREIIEDLLDIKIFSSMNQILKQKQNENKEELNKILNEIKILDEKIKLKNEHITYIETTKNTRTKKIEEKISDLLKFIEKETEKLKELDSKKTELNYIQNSFSELDKKREKFVKMWMMMEVKEKETNKNINYFTNENVSYCLSCGQDISENYKKKKKEELNIKLKEVEEAKKKCNYKISDYKNKIDKVYEKQKEYDLLIRQIHILNSSIAQKNNDIQSLRDELESETKENVNIKDEKKQLGLFKSQKTKKEKLKEECLKNRELYDIVTVLLKDTGIKTRIIRKYVPVINKLINKYLASLDFFVEFELDENFKEEIKSRFRDTFSYENFSEGERMRIDLSLLLTWRSIAKLRNSVNTNLLILDEVFDASLDAEGCESFLKLLYSLGDDSNIFVISHKGDVLVDKFERTIEFEKNKNFSRMVKKC